VAQSARINGVGVDLAILSLSDQYRCCCRKPSSYP